MILSAHDLAQLLRLTQPDAGQILRILVARGLAKRVKPANPTFKGKQPYRFALDDRQVQLLRNLFSPSEEEENAS